MLGVCPTVRELSAALFCATQRLLVESTLCQNPSSGVMLWADIYSCVFLSRSGSLLSSAFSQVSLLFFFF